jgi:hypothetical protein
MLGESRCLTGQLTFFFKTKGERKRSFFFFPERLFVVYVGIIKTVLVEMVIICFDHLVPKIFAYSFLS